MISRKRAEIFKQAKRLVEGVAEEDVSPRAHSAIKNAEGGAP